MGKPAAYMRLYEQLKQDIRTGKYPVGDVLPTETELEQMFGVSRTTVRRAMKALSNDGLADIKQGRGTMVRNFRTTQDLSKVTSVTESLRKKGYTVRTKSIYIDVIAANEKLSGELQLPFGDRLARVQRVQLADEKPVALMTNYIPYALVPQMEQTSESFSALYQFLERRYGITIDAAKDSIWAKASDFAESEMLDVPVGTALLCIRRLCFHEKQPVCLDMVKILGDQYELENFMSGRLK
ncbi:GntR family transcriptional regulator [Ethanoligenens harbinense]|uniref:Transcriptional regulator, GntR family n=1 Tax=Ethanoligenens harbinense (strain DSM 18485 / JCM 12961 / CGMCC 1.5033 / YUAN-3) TaxID=663278 RepID=E6U4C3_ETHHY|nr:GntR family transcriptional regulator [Ethanoligenens harbinense]ADU27730.1 transcriptional regulator, GntR family [Ethanoligenens harbinense YUAN-3]AVQ96759.1 GntR family transcriptional regulator [Ethanoligenens harbinense YUAN-3]AYF39421.1 GntR family transcriptional regulator [Ethanoligenens harbinense]AYF42245.1 GntR family transcriptional regulator [Ethanoligenens harbinense]QCN93001.1 GntR family transcriptional regulator [Ethanoligenens harbinense]